MADQVNIVSDLLAHGDFEVMPNPETVEREMLEVIGALSVLLRPDNILTIIKLMGINNFEKYFICCSLSEKKELDKAALKELVEDDSAATTALINRIAELAGVRK
ncbi:hypothetical protein [Rhodospira trueperi]|uniref:Uncharacterized protein n=1 Tax=Rhodospira trueperi TaxID=69960 RepID=A0A1G7HST9_9PROT|nr:hypothetical protein [Rhodospira trueperi]SDF03413.1 hypothetical protein SAMN05421720_1255 [Rhodospira trueperi]